ncbi:MAG TPA: HAD family phosphatase [Planctomycetaceae bacterium]|nr:HAD family phosphatase [Planctomycetaceae bacterium]
MRATGNLYKRLRSLHYVSFPAFMRFVPARLNSIYERVATMPRCSAVAFDMDGLMFDTEDVYWKAADALLRRRGHAYTQELCDEIMGRPPEHCFRRFKEMFSLPETWRQLQRESEDLFLEFLDDGFALMPGLETLLELLERRRIPKGICTSSAERVVREVLRRYSMRERFDFVLTAEDITHGKPAPEVYLKAAGKFGVVPRSMLVLEDSVAGIRAAVEAGAYAVAVRAHHNRRNDFSHADLVVESLDDPGITALVDR